MSFKSKALGLAAATALSLSIISGVSAEDNVTANLVDGSSKTCSAEILSGTINLGAWTWNNGSYALTSGSASSDMQGKATRNSMSGGNCMVSASMGDLTNKTNGTIFGTAVNITINGGTATVASGTSFPITGSLSSVANNQAPGNYSGELTLSAEAAS